jgi:hypothetical protein
MGDEIRFQASTADAFSSAPTEAGWLGGPVEAACMLRQGHSPSMATAMLGVGVLKLLMPRAAKDLPRTFVLAVTADRVVALDGGGHSEGEGASSVYNVKVDSDEQGSWPRGQVTMTPAKKGMTSNGVLHLAGAEIPVSAPNDDAEPAFANLIAALGGTPSAMSD